MNYTETVRRDEFLQFAKFGDMDAFNVLGVGVTDLAMDYSADEDTTKWVTQKSGQTVSRGYQVTSGVEQIVHKNDPLFVAIDKLRRKLATGADANGQVINVFTYEGAGEKPTDAPAEQWDASISFTSYGGGEDLSIGYTINYNGTPKDGTATLDYEAKTATFL